MVKNKIKNGPKEAPIDDEAVQVLDENIPASQRVEDDTVLGDAPPQDTVLHGPESNVEKTCDSPFTPVGEFADELGALMYYELGGKIQFEVLHKGDKSDWRARAMAAAVALDKMNRAIVPKKTGPGLTPADARRQAVDRAVPAIKAVVQGLSSLNKAHFPAEEMAFKVYDAMFTG